MNHNHLKQNSFSNVQGGSKQMMLGSLGAEAHYSTVNGQ
jgi:hypothetical protein